MSDTNTSNTEQLRENHQAQQVVDDGQAPVRDLVPNTEVEDPNAVHGVIPTQQSATYIEIVAERDATGQPLSVLEVDLVISREKGQENRRLSINFAGIDVEQKELVEKSVNLDEQSFEVLKQFFCQLDWNS